MIKNLEFYAGGIISVIALATIILRLYFLEFNILNILDAIKDSAGILVSVLVFFVAVKSILSQTIAKDTFAKALDRELSSWLERNRPLLSKEEKTPSNDANRYFILSDHDHIFDVGEDFSDGKNYQKGLFVQLPSTYTTKDRVIFFMNKSTFLERAKAKSSTADNEIDKLIYRVANCISAKFSKDLFEASGDLKNNQISVKIKSRELNTPEDAQELIKMLDYVLILYLAAA